MRLAPVPSRALDAPPAAPAPDVRPPPDPLPKMRRSRHRTRRLRQWLAGRAPDALVVLVLLAATAAFVGVLDRTSGPAGPSGSAVRRGVQPQPRSAAAVRTADVHDGAIVAARVAPAAETHLVVHAARGPSWVVVRVGSATGKVLYAAILQQGQRMTASAPRIFLRLGAASQVDVTVNGHPIGRALAGTVDAVLTPAGLGS
jgi:hypothetical protein